MSKIKIAKDIVIKSALLFSPVILFMPKVLDLDLVWTRWAIAIFPFTNTLSSLHKNIQEGIPPGKLLDQAYESTKHLQELETYAWVGLFTATVHGAMQFSKIVFETTVVDRIEEVNHSQICGWAAISALSGGGIFLGIQHLQNKAVGRKGSPALAGVIGTSVGIAGIGCALFNEDVTAVFKKFSVPGNFPDLQLKST